MAIACMGETFLETLNFSIDEGDNAVFEIQVKLLRICCLGVRKVFRAYLFCNVVEKFTSVFFVDNPVGLMEVTHGTLAWPPVEYCESLVPKQNKIKGILDKSILFFIIFQ